MDFCFLRILESRSCIEKSPTLSWNSGTDFVLALICFSFLSWVTILGDYTLALEDSGSLGPLNEPSLPFFLDFVLIQHFLNHLSATRMLSNSNFFCQSNSKRFCSSSDSAFFCFRGLIQAVEDLFHLLIFTTLNVVLVLIFCRC